jgi:hypothetical protein
VHSLIDLIAAAQAGAITSDQHASVARWLEWAKLHYPLIATMREMLDGTEAEDPTAAVD